MPFKLFHRKKQSELETTAPDIQEGQPQTDALTQEPAEESVPDPTPHPVEQTQQVSASDPTEQPEQGSQALPTESIVEQKIIEIEEPSNKTYLKAMPLKELSDIENVKTEVTNGNIIILRITPLAGRSIEDVKTAVNDLFQFAESMGGDIARLGEERVVICPKNIRIWREKTPAPVPSSQPISTVA